MEPQTIKPGDPITAQNLNATALAAKAPAESINPPTRSIRVHVVARAVSQPAVLEEHGYSVSDGTDTWEIGWADLIVPVQPDLIGPSASLGQGFVPAEVVGEGLAIEQPWRAFGVLHRLPGPDDSVAIGVELFGLCPHRGC